MKYYERAAVTDESPTEVRLLSWPSVHDLIREKLPEVVHQYRQLSHLGLSRICLEFDEPTDAANAYFWIIHWLCREGFEPFAARESSDKIQETVSLRRLCEA